MVFHPYCSETKNAYNIDILLLFLAKFAIRLQNSQLAKQTRR